MTQKHNLGATFTELMHRNPKSHEWAVLAETVKGLIYRGRCDSLCHFLESLYDHTVQFDSDIVTRVTIRSLALLVSASFAFL